MRSMLIGLLLTTVLAMQVEDLHSQSYFDATTGFEWAQPTEFTSLTFAELIQEIEDFGEGWRLATAEEAVSLLRSFTSLGDMLSAFGPTWQNPFWETYQQAVGSEVLYTRKALYYWDGRVVPSNPSHIYSYMAHSSGMATYRRLGTTTEWDLFSSDYGWASAGYQSNLQQYITPTESYGNVGAWVLRETVVPEPSTIILLGTGLLGVGLMARRRRRNPTA